MYKSLTSLFAALLAANTAIAQDNHLAPIITMDELTLADSSGEEVQTRQAPSFLLQEHCSDPLGFENFIITDVRPEQEKPFDLMVCLKREIHQFDCEGLEAFLQTTYDEFSRSLATGDGRAETLSGLQRLRDKWLGQVAPTYEAYCQEPLLIGASQSMNLIYG